MFTIDDAKPPKRPVIGSLLGALGEIRAWQAANRLDALKDGDGATWALAVEVEEAPNPSDPKNLLWTIQLRLTTRVSGRDLIATGALDAEKDARLLALLGDETVDLAMRPLTYHATSADAARLLLGEVVPKLRSSLARSGLAEVKRQLLGRWVDRRQVFGGGMAESG